MVYPHHEQRVPPTVSNDGTPDQTSRGVDDVDSSLGLLDETESDGDSPTSENTDMGLGVEPTAAEVTAPEAFTFLPRSSDSE